MAEQQTYNPYTLADIQRYLQGKMSAAEMHAIEKAALQDPFLSDAIEGYSSAPFDVSEQHLNSIAAALGARKEEAKVIPMPIKRRGWLTVAASVLAVAAVGVVATLVFKSPKSSNEAYLAQKKVVPVTADTTQNAVALSPAPLANASSNKAIAQNTPPPVRDNTAAPQAKVREVVPAPATDMLRNVIVQDSIKAADNNGLASANVLTNANQLNNNLPNTGPAYKQNNLSNAAPVTKMDSTAIAANFYRNEAVAAPAPPVEADRELKGRKKSSGLTIQLSPLPGFDSTITVTQLNNKTRQRTISTDTSLLPQGGWETFREYVARQQHKPVDTTETAFEIEGLVELEFTVDDKGLAKEIKITRSLNAESDRQAVEYVKNWPAWITTKNHKGKVVIQF